MQEIDFRKTGQRMKAICKRRNLSVKDIQEKLFIGSYQAIYAWFSGKTLPSLDNLYRLSRLLELPMDWMIVGRHEKYLLDLKCGNMVRSIRKEEFHHPWEIQERVLIYYMNITNKAAS